MTQPPSTTTPAPTTSTPAPPAPPPASSGGANSELVGPNHSSLGDRELFTDTGPHPGIAAGALLPSGFTPAQVAAPAAAMPQGYQPSSQANGGLGGGGGFDGQSALAALSGGGDGGFGSPTSGGYPSSPQGGFDHMSSPNRASLVHSQATKSPIRSSLLMSQGMDPAAAPTPHYDRSPIRTELVHAAANHNPLKSESIMAGLGTNLSLHNRSPIQAAQVHAAATQSPIRSEALATKGITPVYGAPDRSNIRASYVHFHATKNPLASEHVTGITCENPPGWNSPSATLPADKNHPYAAHNIVGSMGYNWNSRGTSSDSPISSDNILRNRSAPTLSHSDAMRQAISSSNLVARRFPTGGGIPAHHLVGQHQSSWNTTHIGRGGGPDPHPPHWAIHASSHMPVTSRRPHIVPYIHKSLERGVDTLNIELAVTQKMQHGRRAENIFGGKVDHCDHHMRYHWP